MSKIFFVIATLAIFCAVSCNAEVLVLMSPEELQDAIAAYPRLVVKFYAPWYYFLPSSSNPLVTDFSGVATASTWNLHLSLIVAHGDDAEVKKYLADKWTLTKTSLLHMTQQHEQLVDSSSIQIQQLVRAHHINRHVWPND